MDWNDLKFFLALAEAKSLSASAARLGTSPSTVSRRVEALEHALKVRLFRPHRDGYSLTEAGLGLVPVAEEAGHRMVVFERNALEAGDDLAGTVRIEAPELLGRNVLLPALIRFMEDYPAIHIELRGSVQPVRLATGEADLVIRLVRPHRGNYRLRRAGKIRFGLYASPDYVARHGIPDRPDDLHRHRVIGWTDDFAFLTMSAWLAANCPGLRPSLRMTTFSAQVEAVSEGAGWAVLPEFIAVPAGFLPGLTSWPRLESDLWLLAQEQSLALQRVRLVRDHVARVLKSKFHSP